MGWAYHNPVAIRFGAGALGELASLVAERRVVLVAFPEATALGHVDAVRRQLGERLAGVVDDIEPNPDVVHLRALHARFWREFADCAAIVALGGGSTIDTAKVLAVAPASGAFDDLVAALAAGRTFEPAKTKAQTRSPARAAATSSARRPADPGRAGVPRTQEERWTQQR